MKILMLSGPNLDLLGKREPDVYGTQTLEDHVQLARDVADRRATIEHVQSASEEDLIRAVHGASGSIDAIVINAGALTHYGWSLHDALAAFDGIVVEIHISNTRRRESWRHTSVLTPVAAASLQGLGRHAYAVGVDVALRLLGDREGRHSTT